MSQANLMEFNKEDEPVRLDAYGCADQSEVVDSFPGISADGGGW